MEFNPTVTPTEFEDTVNTPAALAPVSSGQVLIKTLSGDVVPIDYVPDLTISQIKNVIHSNQRVPTDQQRLIYQGKQLEDANTLDDYGIVAGNTIHLVLRVKGGMKLFLF